MPTTIAPTVDDVLNSDEQSLIVQALHKLLEVKQDALSGIEEARTNGMPILNGRKPFQPSDFGIPQIRDLLNKFNGTDEDEDTDGEQHTTRHDLQR